jgi:hypothetical protein
MVFPEVWTARRRLSLADGAANPDSGRDERPVNQALVDLLVRRRGTQVPGPSHGAKRPGLISA